jgi:aspartyl/asparaginyl beta-hydroxylase (cupin superfamily)
MYKAIFRTDETVDAAPLLEEFERTMSQRLEVLYQGLDAWTGVTLYRRNAENELSQMPALSRVIDQIGLEHVAAVFFYKLKAGAKQHEHRDMQGNLLFGCSRVHIPLRTNPGAQLIIEGLAYHLSEGEVWCLDTSGRHAAVNSGDEDRIHLVIDVLRSPATERYFPPRNWETRMHLTKFVGIMAVKLTRDALSRPTTLLGRARRMSGILRPQRAA